MPKLQALPIDPLLPQIAAALREAPSLVVQATPGSGKTTRIPPYLLAQALVEAEQEILVLVPRRLAAKMAALRVAEELGEAAGERVGYQFRFENVSGPKTRLRFLTEGMLLRFLVQDPRLERAGMVVLDEFHERHLHSDVALGYLRSLQQGARPDLKLLVMSATLQVEGLVPFLPGSRVFQLEAPAFPVAVEYLPSDPKKPVEAKVREALAYAKGQAPPEIRRGDVLVFLPGMAEILRCADALERAFGAEFLILPLHGELPKEAQAKVFAKADRPKVILATNVAETSLTIEGVTLVIDSGLQRQASYSWWSGIPALKTRPTSKASGIQRAGRAGRTAPGLCYRLYSAADWEARLAFETPEIRRSDLAQTLLEIKAMGTQRLSDFGWFEAPPEGALQASAALLHQLGATETPDLDAALSRLGRRMAAIPIHPRLARFLLEAERRDCLGAALRLAALISEDALEEVDVFHQLETGRLTEPQRRLIVLWGGHFSKAAVQARGREEELAYALLTGFPDRVARRRLDSASAEKQRAMERGGEVELVFCNGGAGLLRGEAALEGEWCVVLDVQEKQHAGQARPKVHVSALAPIQPEWLFDWQGSLLAEERELVWDERLGRVFQVSRIRYGQLVISESREAPEDGAAAERLFLKSALSLELEGSAAESLEVPGLLQRLGSSEELETEFSRLDWLRRAHPEVPLPELRGRGLAEFLLKILAGVDSRQAWERLDLPRACLEALPPEAAALLSRELPGHVVLQAGRRVRVHYPWGREPWIESRLQDFFGMKEGPKLAGGRVPLLLHLLAPNQRAVQVTKDLAGFWKNTYPEIRKQLMRRYPKHRWPEDAAAVGAVRERPLRGKA